MRHACPFRAPFALAAALALAVSAHAGFNFAQVPSIRGGPCSRYAGWETFTSPAQGANAPDDPQTTATTATLTQLVPGAILTSAGNIYDPLQVLHFVLADSVAFDLQDVVLQTSTQGNGLALASVRLRYTDGAAQVQSLAPTTIQFLGTSGMHEERLFAWDLAALADTILAYEIVFDATAPSTSLDALLLDTRDACPPGVPFCFGDGSAAGPCPCANVGLAGRGCENSAATGGALLTASGRTSDDSIVLTAQGTLPSSLAIFLQGSSALGTGLAFGDGLRCAGGVLKRLYVAHAVGGSVSAPAVGAPSVMTQSALLGDPLTAGAVRSYQVYYRDPSASFCPAPQGNTWNVSNGYSVTW